VIQETKYKNCLVFKNVEDATCHQYSEDKIKGIISLFTDDTYVSNSILKLHAESISEYTTVYKASWPRLHEQFKGRLLTRIVIHFPFDNKIYFCWKHKDKNTECKSIYQFNHPSQNTPLSYVLYHIVKNDLPIKWLEADQRSRPKYKDWMACDDPIFTYRGKLVSPKFGF